MKCAVIKIVISLIISEICLTTSDIGNQLEITDGSSTKIQSCIRKIIEHILNPSESLAFVITSHPDYIPSGLPNPVTLVDIREPIPTHYERYEVNYVIEAESWVAFAEAFNTITYYPLWHNNESPKGKFVILIKEEEALQVIFYRLWREIWALHIIVVIYDDTFKNCPMKVITGNPQAVENDCARQPTVFSNFSCDNISIEFLKPLRNYNGCSVYILTREMYREFNFNRKGHRLMYNLVAGLKRSLNVTPRVVASNKEKALVKLRNLNEIVLAQTYFDEYTDSGQSIIFSRQLFIWCGPPRKPISPINTIFLPFNYDLWIAVLLITVLMILLKWIIMKGNGYNNNYVNLACAFTDIIGLTFGVCVNRIPNIWSLKLLLAFFLVYVIHIHTAYTSDLINILTEPRYESRISNLEELAASGLPIFMSTRLATNYFKNVTDANVLFGKINKLIIPFDFDAQINVSNFFFAVEEDGALISNSSSTFNVWYLRKKKVNAFLTNDLSGEIKEVLINYPGSYFLESLNAVITHLLESGTFEADASLNTAPYLVEEKESESVLGASIPEKIPHPLRLKNVLPIFVILLICYSFCIFIFVAEILVHKIVAYNNRNQVVPLNV